MSLNQASLIVVILFLSYLNYYISFTNLLNYTAKLHLNLDVDKFYINFKL